MNRNFQKANLTFKMKLNLIEIQKLYKLVIKNLQRGV